MENSNNCEVCLGISFIWDALILCLFRNRKPGEAAGETGGWSKLSKAEGLGMYVLTEQEFPDMESGQARGKRRSGRW